MNSVLIVVGLIVLIITVYLIFIRPWQQCWGATDEEVARPMLGDEIVQHPSLNATRAITVNARPEDIWPWIVQIGFGRAGWYSYDWIDNLGKPSEKRIVPEWQDLKVGDKIYLSQWTYEIVKQIEPYQGILWVGADSAATAGTWSWGFISYGGRTDTAYHSLTGAV